eukprot:EG_transcript_6083
MAVLWHWSATPVITRHDLQLQHPGVVAQARGLQQIGGRHPTRRPVVLAAAQRHITPSEDKGIAPLPPFPDRVQTTWRRLFGVAWAAVAAALLAGITVALNKRTLPRTYCCMVAAAADVESPPSTTRSKKEKRRAEEGPDDPDSEGPAYQFPLPAPTYPNFGWQTEVGPAGGQARLGLLTTPHGAVETPAFIFCATKANIKGLPPDMVRDAGTQIILSNTYHLMLQPGSPLVRKLGGLQTVTGWRGPMLTDSGGYQIFSMGYGSVSSEIKGQRGAAGFSTPTVQRITEEGARFRSYVDGSPQDLTPESSIVIQRELGADLILVLDECTPFHVDKAYTARAMRRSHRWAVRSLTEFAAHDDGTQALYGIIQGGVHEDLRAESVAFVNRQPFFGTAIGGSLGADRATMHAVVGYTAARCRPDRPIHLLGIGGIRDIFHGVRCGIDTFDCVHPTRLGRHGGALVQARYWDEEQPESRVTREHIHLEKARFRDDIRPIDSTCGCYTCRNFSRGYLHHLLRAQETLGGTLASLHNVYFVNRMMAAIRVAIRNGTLAQEEAVWVHPRLYDRNPQEQQEEQRQREERQRQRAAQKERRIAEQLARRSPAPAADTHACTDTDGAPGPNPCSPTDDGSEEQG